MKERLEMRTMNNEDNSNQLEEVIQKYSMEQLVYAIAISEEQIKQSQVERKLLLEEAKRRLRK